MSIIKTRTLPPDILQVVRDKGTELPMTGEYNDWDQPGTYLCRQCGLALYRARAKFHSGCGWPSYDEEISGAIAYESDKDGRRTEILCAHCKAHLGHVFKGEGFTAKNTRHCVNSLSLDFVPDEHVIDTEEAIFAAGCFWGVEYYLSQFPGVLKTVVGYSGGQMDYPTYEKVCAGNSGHLETIRVLYDPSVTNYKAVVQYFFEIHDPTQSNGQGPDLGSQYLSAIFYLDERQKEIANNVVDVLLKKGMDIKTKILPAAVFWRAEDYHQKYYAKTGGNPYCHRYTRLF